MILRKFKKCGTCNNMGASRVHGGPGSRTPHNAEERQPDQQRSKGMQWCLFIFRTLNCIRIHSFFAVSLLSLLTRSCLILTNNSTSIVFIMKVTNMKVIKPKLNTSHVPCFVHSKLRICWTISTCNCSIKNLVKLEKAEEKGLLYVL